MAVEDGTLHTYLGGWAEYARAREEREADGGARTQGRCRRHDAASRRIAGARERRRTECRHGRRRRVPRAGGVSGGPKRPEREEAKPKGPSKNRITAQQKAEAEVEAAEASLSELEAELAQPEAWATRYESAKSEARHTAARRAVEAAYERLQALTEDG